MKKSRIAWSLAATTMGVTGVGALTGDLSIGLASLVLGAITLASALGIRRQAMMGKLDAEVMYALR